MLEGTHLSHDYVIPRNYAEAIRIFGLRLECDRTSNNKNNNEPAGILQYMINSSIYKQTTYQNIMILI